MLTFCSTYYTFMKTPLKDISCPKPIPYSRSIIFLDTHFSFNHLPRYALLFQSSFFLISFLFLENSIWSVRPFWFYSSFSFLFIHSCFLYTLGKLLIIFLVQCVNFLRAVKWQRFHKLKYDTKPRTTLTSYTLYTLQQDFDPLPNR